MDEGKVEKSRRLRKQDGNQELSNNEDADGKITSKMDGKNLPLI